MEEVVASAGITLDRVHHGYGIVCWAVNRRALPIGHGIRTGLADVPALPDNSSALGDVALVAAAVELINGEGSR